MRQLHLKRSRSIADESIATGIQAVGLPDDVTDFSATRVNRHHIPVMNLETRHFPVYIPRRPIEKKEHLKCKTFTLPHYLQSRHDMKQHKVPSCASTGTVTQSATVCCSVFRGIPYRHLELPTDNSDTDN